ncbi:PREDICTED: uncharacterized protein LOC107349379 isoform X2 [Acropora digitifera]|uniref:uncharacterized protein LOC107349379 isoform X2 n=1 Tax=Acropora digitifera TaxID=70779 RepID=UPI00077AD51A|nr:PREDICTED: uncharacterized protein LOC107349379 isoform X2 [Acropora digitifera]
MAENGLKISVHFSGGAELLFNKVKEHEVVLPNNANPCLGGLCKEDMFPCGILGLHLKQRALIFSAWTFEMDKCVNVFG